MTSNIESLDYYDCLEKRLMELIQLTIKDEENIKIVGNLICRYTKDLKDKTIKEKSEDTINSAFKYFVKCVLSVIETLINGEQYKALRRLLQNEIYACNKIIIQLKK